MVNNTKSKIIIEMNHLDHATNLFNFISLIKKIASQGGDLELNIISNDEFVAAKFIGHDVDILNVNHEINKENI